MSRLIRPVVLALAAMALAPAAAHAACPCSIWPSSATPATASTADNSAVELGVKFRSDSSGYIKGLRFYKGSLNTGTHIGSLWTASGALLASATFTNETASGWQTLTFAGPVPIAANTTYVASYHTDVGYYSSNTDYFATAGVDAPPLHALKDGVDGGNGVYRYGGNAFPSFSFRSTNYWVDVVFDLTAGDSTPPSITDRAPASGATGAPVGAPVVATFSEPVQPDTIAMSLAGPGGGAVPGTKSYDAATQSVSFTPSEPLAYSTTYTATVSGAQDAAGNTMAADSWSFTTAAPPPPPTDQGPGGPVLLVSSSSNPFSSYYTEILRTEGLNEFSVIDVSQLAASALAGKDVVVLADEPITTAQVGVLTDFVNAGGNLVAMRPDPKLAGLLGLTRATGSRSEGYVAVDTAVPAAAGITAQTMQYHGVADRYALNGATAVATLYSDATTPTGDPAVTLNTVGASGGQAAAFTYDLARSLMLTRQGNPGWAGQERDGLTPIRSDDLYFGGSLADWVALSKVAIPQADEQQRLLANLIETMVRDRTPLPRFWYFPRALKAVIVGTGDDHASGGTAGRFDEYLANSPAGCSVVNWTCPRYTSYIYTATPLSNTKAATYDSKGFEIGLHPNTGCSDYTPASLAQTFSTQLAKWRSKYKSLPSPVTNRTHCLVWSDWLSEPRTELSNAIRLDTNYYYWPGTWVQDRPGFMTGSGMPMRFLDTNGTMVDAYQAATAMTDESNQSYPFTPDELLNAATGPQGYYGAFTANFHTDGAITFENDQTMASAQAHGVPIIAARQMLAWLDGRNASAFKDIAYSPGKLTFSVAAGANTTGLTAMVPTLSADGLLSSLTLNGAPVSYQTQTIKGLEYAVFTTAAGTYSASYSPPPAAAPTITAMTADTTDQGAVAVTWSTPRPATTEVAWGESAGTLDRRTVVAESTREHRLALPRLTPGEVYYFRVTSRDATGRESTFPAADRPPYAYRVPAWLASPPGINGLRAVAMPDGYASVQWSTMLRSDGTLEYGTSPTALTQDAEASGFGLLHSVSVDGLAPGQRYYYRVTSSTAWGARSVSPVQSFDAPDYGVADSRLAQWQMGEASGVVAVAGRGDGELRLADPGGRGTFVSRLLDAEQMVGWTQALWDAEVPSGASLTVEVRTGSTSPPDQSWTPWIDVPRPGAPLSAAVAPSRYLQYRLRLAGGSATPVVRAVGVTSTGHPIQHPTEGGG